MDLLQSAKELALKNFRIFPLRPLSKLPAIKDFPHNATTDIRLIESWWARNPNYNIGISTEELVAVDVDNKGDKKGSLEVARLRAEGKDFPETFEQLTPTLGHHLLYSTDEPIRQGVNVLGPGLDIRSSGGYVVGAGSRLSNGVYSAIPRAVRSAPEWLLAACKRARKPDESGSTPLEGVDRARAVERATRYLLTEAPLAIKGQGGDLATYRVAARVKDLGCDLETCLILMLDHWNDRTTPGWRPERLREKVAHAYHYGNQPIGSADPGTQFDIVPEDKTVTLSPLEKLNLEYKYIAGNKGFILHETTDSKGRSTTEILDVSTFHRNLAPLTWIENKRTVPISESWMKSPLRKTYDAICFRPGEEVSSRFYNLWKGFRVKPLAPDEIPSPRAQASLDTFLAHARENICENDPFLSHWLISYFAHMIQRPSEKPLVAVVFKGGKGLGKSVFVSRIRYLLGDHATVVSHRHRLTGNFNSVLENKIFLTLEEAFWSGDKVAEGVLKELITGDTHSIERKNHETYEVDNCLRLAILGNEDWVVPASADERRYAVFNIRKGRFGDRDFHEMRLGMEAGGYPLLLRFLQNYDLSDIDFSRAPKSTGLLEQKIESLSPFHTWWHDSLDCGTLLGSQFEGRWPETISVQAFRTAFQAELKLKNVNVRVIGPKQIRNELRKCCPSVENRAKRSTNEVYKAYFLPPLAQARQEWETYIGHSEVWEENEYEDLFS